MRLQEITQKDKETFITHNISLIDEIEVGSYTIMLTTIDTYSTKELYQITGQSLKYQIAITTTGTSFTLPNDQHTKIPNNASELFKYKHEFHKILQNWKQQYGTLVVGTFNKRYYNIYKKLIKTFGFNPIPIINTNVFYIFYF